MIELLTEEKIIELLESGNYRNDEKLGKALSNIENDIVNLLLKGYDSRLLIAQHLNKSEHTIRNQLVSIYDKLNVNSTSAIIAYCYNLKMPHPENVLELIELNEENNDEKQKTS